LPLLIEFYEKTTLSEDLPLFSLQALLSCVMSFPVFLISLLSIISGWLYYSLQYASKWQATIGMRSLNIKIVGLKYQKISFLHGTGRYFSEFLSDILFGIGYLMIAFTQKSKVCMT
jgi:uncharacterized RDD family membrane protein YckC